MAKRMNGRRIFVAVLIGSLIGSMVAAQAADAKAKKHTRKAKGTYSTPAIGAAGQGGGNCSLGIGCVEFPTGKSDRTIAVKITDSSGQPVFASVSQDKTTGPGVHNTVHVGDICGKTTKPLVIDGGFPVDVFLWEGPGASPQCAGVATQGTVAATFSS